MLELFLAAALFLALLALVFVVMSKPGGACGGCGVPLPPDRTLCDACDDARSW